MKLSLPPNLVDKLVWVPIISFCRIFIPIYTFDALLCRNWLVSPPSLTLRITLLRSLNFGPIYNKKASPMVWFLCHFQRKGVNLCKICCSYSHPIWGLSCIIMLMFTIIIVDSHKTNDKIWIWMVHYIQRKYNSFVKYRNPSPQHEMAHTQNMCNNKTCTKT